MPRYAKVQDRTPKTLGLLARMIVLHNVTKQFPDGALALKELSAKFEQGEFVSVIGRSGSGKSTFLRLINGTILPSSGTMEVLGHKVNEDISAKELKLLRREIGFIFQQHNLIKSHTVLSNVLMGRLGYKSTIKGLLGMFTAEEKDMAMEIISEVGLKDQANKRVDQMSGGQQQRVAIARALVQQPKILLADEPMASLDPKMAETVLELLYQFNQQRKITVLVNVHVLELAKKRATRIVGLKKGKFAFDGTPAELTAEKVALVYGD